MFLRNHFLAFALEQPEILCCSWRIASLPLCCPNQLVLSLAVCASNCVSCNAPQTCQTCALNDVLSGNGCAPGAISDAGFHSLIAHLFCAVLCRFSSLARSYEWIPCSSSRCSRDVCLFVAVCTTNCQSCTTPLTCAICDAHYTLVQGTNICTPGQFLAHFSDT